MNNQKKIIGIVVLALLSLFPYGAERFATDTSIYQRERENTEVIGEREFINTSRIWTRGPTGDAAENATHHFQKHGKEFGFKTEQDYVAAAVKFTTEPLAEGVLKNIQKDNDVAYYNPKTAEYAVKSKRGFIRTYFKLNPKIHGYATNTEYFNAHAKIGAHPPANNNYP